MTFSISSNSTSMLTVSPKETCSDYHSDFGISAGHYSLNLLDKEGSSIGSLPSLYRHKDFEDDTEDTDDDNVPPAEPTKESLSVSPPQTYSPQLNFILHSPSPSVASSIKSYSSSHTYSISNVSGPSTSAVPAVSTSAAAVHTPMDDKTSKTPLYSIPCSSSTLNMDIRSPLQPSLSSSRFLNAFHRFRYGHTRQSANHNNSVAPAEVTTIKLSSTKSSLADKIKSKFQKQKTTKVVVANKKKIFSTPRSASFSSVTQWSQHNNHKSTSATDKAMIHSASTTPLMSEKTGSSSSSSVSSASVAVTNGYATTSAFSLTKSISSHRLYTHKSSLDTNPHHLRQPLRAINSNRHEPLFNSKSRVRFTTLVSVRETYSKAEYDRGSDPNAVCIRLTPAIAQGIKEELNAYKLHEMQVHECSRVHTHFFL